MDRGNPEIGLSAATAGDQLALLDCTCLVRTPSPRATLQRETQASSEDRFEHQVHGLRRRLGEMDIRLGSFAERDIYHRDPQNLNQPALNSRRIDAFRLEEKYTDMVNGLAPTCSAEPRPV
jgi:hypothetical protein